jgi:hypothetical protein
MAQDRPISRRKLIEALFVTTVIGVAGCTGDTGGATTEDSDNTTESETGGTDGANTQAKWKENVPPCSSGDYRFQIIEVDETTVSEPAVIFVENITNSTHTIEDILIKGDDLYRTLDVGITLNGGDRTDIEIVFGDGGVGDTLYDLQDPEVTDIEINGPAPKVTCR